MFECMQSSILMAAVIVGSVIAILSIGIVVLIVSSFTSYSTQVRRIYEKVLIACVIVVVATISALPITGAIYRYLIIG